MPGIYNFEQLVSDFERRKIKSLSDENFPSSDDLKNGIRSFAHLEKILRLSDDGSFYKILFTQLTAEHFEDLLFKHNIEKTNNPAKLDALPYLIQSLSPMQIGQLLNALNKEFLSATLPTAESLSKVFLTIALTEEAFTITMQGLQSFFKEEDFLNPILSLLSPPRKKLLQHAFNELNSNNQDIPSVSMAADPKEIEISRIETAHKEEENSQPINITTQEELITFLTTKEISVYPKGLCSKQNYIKTLLAEEAKYQQLEITSLIAKLTTEQLIAFTEALETDVFKNIFMFHDHFKPEYVKLLFSQLKSKEEVEKLVGSLKKYTPSVSNESLEDKWITIMTTAMSSVERETQVILLQYISPFLDFEKSDRIKQIFESLKMRSDYAILLSRFTNATMVASYLSGLYIGYGYKSPHSYDCLYHALSTSHFSKENIHTKVSSAYLDHLQKVMPGLYALWSERSVQLQQQDTTSSHNYVTNYHRDAFCQNIATYCNPLFWNRKENFIPLFLLVLRSTTNSYTKQGRGREGLLRAEKLLAIIDTCEKDTVITRELIDQLHLIRRKSSCVWGSHIYMINISIAFFCLHIPNANSPRYLFNPKELLGAGLLEAYVSPSQPTIKAVENIQSNSTVSVTSEVADTNASSSQPTAAKNTKSGSHVFASMATLPQQALKIFTASSTLQSWHGTKSKTDNNSNSEEMQNIVKDDSTIAAKDDAAKKERLG
jgi:hypothetical protein